MMAERPVEFSPLARRDLDDCAAYLAGQANLQIALWFLESVEATCATLAAHPRFGRARAFGASDLAGLRSFRVQDFTNHLIFYVPRAHGIEVVRVLHGARDLEARLGEAESAASEGA